MNWTTPQSDVTIFEYHAQFRRSETLTWGSQVTAIFPYTILPALNASTEFDVRVRAVSAAGDGEWSEVQSERTFNSEYIYCS